MVDSIDVRCIAETREEEGRRTERLAVSDNVAAAHNRYEREEQHLSVDIPISDAAVKDVDLLIPVSFLRTTLTTCLLTWVMPLHARSAQRSLHGILLSENALCQLSWLFRGLRRRL